MTTPIQLNLADLTDEAIEEAITAGRDKCAYTAPCIIGSLMTEEQRRKAERAGDGETTVYNLVGKGVFSFPDARQARAANTLQQKFDNPGGVTDAAVRRYARTLRERFTNA